MHIVRFGIPPVAKIATRLLSIFALMSYCPSLGAQSAGATGSDVSQAIYAPIAGLKEFDRWEISVVNRTSATTAAVLTVYSLEGNPYPARKITLASNETRRLDIRTLLPPDIREETIGGISIDFKGQVMGIGAQVTISGFHGFGNIDVPVFDDMMYKSNEADSVWWEPKGAHSNLILGNSSADPLHAQIAFATGARLDVDLAPHASNVQAIPEEAKNRHEGSINWVHVTGTGMAGTLRVTGYTTSVSEGFLNTIRSYDPASSTESAVYANGLPFSDAENHLVVKNLTLNPITMKLSRL